VTGPSSSTCSSDGASPAPAASRLAGAASATRSGFGKTSSDAGSAAGAGSFGRGALRRSGSGRAGAPAVPPRGGRGSFCRRGLRRSGGGTRAAGSGGGCSLRMRGQSNSMSGLRASIDRIALSSSADRPTLTPGGVRNQYRMRVAARLRRRSLWMTKVCS